MRKRRLSAVLALILALSMSFSSFAEESNAEGGTEVVTETDDKTGEETVPEENSEDETTGEEVSGEEESEEVTEEETIAEEAAETEEASEGEETATDEDGEEAASEEDASEGSDGEDAAGEEATSEEESEAEAAGEEALEDDETAEEESEEETGEESEEEDTGDDDGADAADLYEAVSGKTYVIKGEDGSAAAEVTLTWEEDTFGTAPNAVRIAYVTDTTSVEEYYEEQGLEVIDAAGVDITFYAFETDEDGNAVPAYDENGDFDEIYSVQPVSGQTVTVSITLAADQALETETSDGTEAEIVIVHEADDGTLTELEGDAAIEATGETVTFEAESFSIYYTVTLSDGSTTQYDYSDYIKVDENTKTITVSQSDESAGYEIQAALNYLDSLAEGTTDDSEGAEDGWTITVTAGTYSRFTVYNTLDNLTIQAADGAEVIISVLDGSDAPATTSGAYPETGGVSIRDCENVVLDGLTFKAGSEVSSPWYAAAVSTTVQTTEKAINPTIRNCTFIGVGSNYGYFSDNIESWTIENCTFSDFSSAIEFYGDNVTSGTVSITGNTFTGCSFAIHGYTNGGSMSFTNNTVTGSSSLRCKIVLQDQYGKGDLTVDVSGNTLTNAMIGLVNISAYSVSESSAEALKAANTLDENSYVVVATNDEGNDYSTIYFSPESSHGYWALTNIADNNNLDVSWGSNPTGTDDYVKSVIDKANANGVHTLSFSVLNSDLIRTFTWFKDAIYWVGSDEDEEEPSVTKSVDKSTVEAGDTVTFTLNVSAPEYLEIYGTTSNYDSIIRYPAYVDYKVTVHDEMNSVFTMNNDIVVSIDGAAIDSSYYEIVTDTDDDCDFEVVIDFAKLLDDGLLTADSDGVYPDVIITYTATVAEGTAAGTYENTTWVTYEVDGESDTSTVTVTVEEPEEETTTTTTSTGAIAVVKVDADTGAYLSGASFTVYNESEGQYIGTFTTDENGYFSVGPLTLNYTYVITEVTAPDGYILDSTPIRVTLTSEMSSNASYPYTIRVENTAEGIAVVESASIEEAEGEPGEVLGAEREVETIAATGDDSNILFWLILMLAAGAGIGGILLVSGKRSRL